MSQDVLNIKNHTEKKYRSLNQKNKIRSLEKNFLISLLFTIIILIWIVIIQKKDIKSRFLITKLICTKKYNCVINEDKLYSIKSFYLFDSFMINNINIFQNQINNFSWIKKIKKRKTFSDELKTHLIVECISNTYWNNQLLINDNNQLFFNMQTQEVFTNKKNFSKLYGPEENKNEVVKNFCEMKNFLLKNKFILKEATMTSRHSWYLMLDNGVKINLGRENMIRRLMNFVDLYPFLLQQANIVNKKISYVDLRYESGLAISFVSVPSENFISKKNNAKIQVK